MTRKFRRCDRRECVCCHNVAGEFQLSLACSATDFMIGRLYLSRLANILGVSPKIGRGMFVPWQLPAAPVFNSIMISRNAVRVLLSFSG